METFGTEEELRGFLEKMEPVYSKYSNALFMAGVHNASIIAAADVASLTSLKIPRLHALNLIARCKGTGMLLLPSMLRCSVHVGLMSCTSSMQHVPPALDHQASKEGLGVICPWPASLATSIHAYKVPLASKYRMRSGASHTPDCCNAVTH